MGRLGWFAAVGFFALGGCGRSNSPEKSAIDSVIDDNNMVEISEIDLQSMNQFESAIEGIGQMTGSCTAFHIGRGIAVSAGHCFYGEKTGTIKNHPCQAININWGARKEYPSRFKSRCIKIIERQLNSEVDFAIFKVDPPPPAQVEMASLSAPTSEIEELSVLGYPQEKSLTRSASCHILNFFPETHSFEHDCDTLPGSSGSPVFNNQGQVIGVHNGGDEGSNFATSITAFTRGSLFPTTLPEQVTTNKKERWQWTSFRNNENRLLKFVPQAIASHVSLSIQIDLEKKCDFVVVTDGLGHTHRFTGKINQELSVKTPATLVFSSDYAAPSNSIEIVADYDN